MPAPKTMTTDPNIIKQLRGDEAVRQLPYDDATGETLAKGMTLAGNLTIGIGRNLSADGLRPQEIDMLCANDVQEVIDELRSRLPWFDSLDSVRQGVLINMAFNMGTADLMGWGTFLGLVKAGQYAAAAQDMAKTPWASEVGARATRLERQMRTGAWVFA